MAFCPHCRSEVSDGAKICTSCGGPLDNVNEPAANEDVVETTTNSNSDAVDLSDVANKATEAVNAVTEKVKALDKKTLGIIGGVAVAVIALLFVLGGSNSYMSPMNDFMKLVNKQAENRLDYEYALMADFRVKLAKNMLNATVKANDDYQDSLDDANEALADYYEEIMDEYDSFKLTFEVKKAEKMDKDDLDDLADSIEDSSDYYLDMVDEYKDMLEDEDELEEYADYMDMDEDDLKKVINATCKYYESFDDVKVTEAYEVKGKFIIKAEDDEFKTDTVKLIMVKMNGDWVYAGSDDYISFDNDDDNLFYFIESFLSKGYVTK